MAARLGLSRGGFEGGAVGVGLGGEICKGAECSRSSGRRWVSRVPVISRPSSPPRVSLCSSLERIWVPVDVGAMRESPRCPSMFLSCYFVLYKLWIV